jgi:sugar phosphate isomerase/epimerase
MKLGLFSVSYAGLWGQHRLDLPAFIAKASSLGYDAVMLMGKRPHLSPLDVTAEQVASIRSALEQHRIQCAAVAAYTDLAGTTAAEVPYLEMQIAYVEALARIAAELGASVVRVFTAYEVQGQSLHATWQRVVGCLREICDRAAAYGVTIAVQNHHDLAVHTDVLLELLEDVDRPNCKAALDAWSPALRGEQLYEAARRMAPYTAITTNADYVRLPRYRYRPELVNYERALPDMVRAVKFGEGFIDYPAFFRGLQEGEFDGIANYEICCPIRGGGSEENLDAYASCYVQWMRRHVLQSEGDRESSD